MVLYIEMYRINTLFAVFIMYAGAEVLQFSSVV